MEIHPRAATAAAAAVVGVGLGDRAATTSNARREGGVRHRPVASLTDSPVWVSVQTRIRLIMRQARADEIHESTT